MENYTHAEASVIKALINDGGSSSECYARKLLKGDIDLFDDGDKFKDMWGYLDPDFKQAVVCAARIGWRQDEITVDNFQHCLSEELIRRKRNRLMFELTDNDRYRYDNDDEGKLYDVDYNHCDILAQQSVSHLFV